MLLGALMAVGSVATLVLTRSQAQQMALDTSVKSLKGVVHEAFLMIDQVEKSVERTVTAVEQQLDDPDAMYGYSRLLLEHHPYLSGCSISFEPDYFKSKTRRLYPKPSSSANAAPGYALSGTTRNGKAGI